MNRSLIFVAAATLALSSCSTVSHTSLTEAVDTKIVNMTVADLEVGDQKVSKTLDWKWTPLSSVSDKDTKANATGELLIEKDADVLIEPQYVVKRRGLFRGGSVTVSGYPATYRNFRPMTQKDAELIAMANGAYMPGVPVMMESSSCYGGINGKKKAKKAVFQKDKKEIGGSFLSLTWGPTFFTNDDYETGVNYGLMYGNYGKSWGWYGKLSLLTAYYDDGRSDYDGNKTTCVVTFGAIKTLGRHFNLFFGAGLGGYMTTEDTDDYRYYKPANKFGIPLEIGGQWHHRRINLMLGVNGLIPTAAGDGNFNTFLGIGYNF